MTAIEAGDTVRVTADEPRRHYGDGGLTVHDTLPTGHVFTVYRVDSNDGDLIENTADGYRYVRPEDVEKVEPAPVLRVGQTVLATRTIEGKVTYSSGTGRYTLGTGDGAEWVYSDGWSFEVLAEPTPPLPTTPDSKVRDINGHDAVLFRDEWRWLNNGDVAYPAEWVGGFTVVRDAGADQ